MHRGYTCLWRKVWSNAVLAEPGRRFSRLEAWLYITNVLAAVKDGQAAGLKRGEFVASIRQCAGCFNWSHGAVQRFLDMLLQNSMIMRVVRETGHLAGQEAGHFRVCKYDTNNPTRDTERDTERDTKRDTYEEVLKESININNNINNNNNNKYNKDTHRLAPARACRRKFFWNYISSKIRRCPG
jgi:hypothetical protein